MKEQYHNLDLGNQKKWSVIRSDSLNNYSALQFDDPKWASITHAEASPLNVSLDQKERVSEPLQGIEWVSIKNPQTWKPKIAERGDEAMEHRITPVEAIQPYSVSSEPITTIPPVVVKPARQREPVAMPYQSVMDVEPITPAKPERLKKADRQGGPTNKERHALRDLVAGRQVAPKIEEQRLQELLEQRVQQEPLPLPEGLQAIDTTKRRLTGGVIVDFTR